jgi:hypothetical protein
MRHKVKQQIKRLIERLFHIRIYKTRVHGRNYCEDIARLRSPDLDDCRRRGE